MCAVLLPAGVSPIAAIKYIISYYQIKGKTLNIPVYVTEAYGTARLALHLLPISAPENSSQLHTPAALFPGTSAAVINQKGAGGTLSQSGWGRGFWRREKSLDLPGIKTHSSIYGL